MRKRNFFFSFFFGGASETERFQPLVSVGFFFHIATPSESSFFYFSLSLSLLKTHFLVPKAERGSDVMVTKRWFFGVLSIHSSRWIGGRWRHPTPPRTRLPTGNSRSFACLVKRPEREKRNDATRHKLSCQVQRVFLSSSSSSQTLESHLKEILIPDLVSAKIFYFKRDGKKRSLLKSLVASKESRRNIFRFSNQSIRPLRAPAEALQHKNKKRPPSSQKKEEEQ